MARLVPQSFWVSSELCQLDIMLLYACRCGETINNCLSCLRSSSIDGWSQNPLDSLFIYIFWTVKICLSICWTKEKLYFQSQWWTLSHFIIEHKSHIAKPLQTCKTWTVFETLFIYCLFIKKHVHSLFVVTHLCSLVNTSLYIYLYI